MLDIVRVETFRPSHRRQKRNEVIEPMPEHQKDRPERQESKLLDTECTTFNTWLH